MDRHRGETMERHSFSLPKGVCILLRQMAIKRLEESGLIAEKGWRPTARDILCVAMMLSHPQIRDMSLKEFEDEVKKAMRYRTE